MKALMVMIETEGANAGMVSVYLSGSGLEGKRRQAVEEDFTKGLGGTVPTPAVYNVDECPPPSALPGNTRDAANPFK